MAYQSDASLHLQKVWERLFAFRARIDLSEQGYRQSITGTERCVATSRELLARIDLKRTSGLSIGPR